MKTFKIVRLTLTMYQPISFIGLVNGLVNGLHHLSRDVTSFYSIISVLPCLQMRFTFY